MAAKGGKKKQFRVLVVEDQPEWGAAIELGFMQLADRSGRQGTVHRAGTYREFVQLVEAAVKSGETYHVLSVDINLKSVDRESGAEVIKYAADTAIFSSLVVISAYASDDTLVHHVRLDDGTYDTVREALDLFLHSHFASERCFLFHKTTDPRASGSVARTFERLHQASLVSLATHNHPLLPRPYKLAVGEGHAGARWVMILQHSANTFHLIKYPLDVRLIEAFLGARDRTLSFERVSELIPPPKKGARGAKYDALADFRRRLRATEVRVDPDCIVLNVANVGYRLLTPVEGLTVLGEGARDSAFDEALHGTYSELGAPGWATASVDDGDEEDSGGSDERGNRDLYLINGEFNENRGFQIIDPVADLERRKKIRAAEKKAKADQLKKDLESGGEEPSQQE